MKTYKVNLYIRAECEADARELLEDYTGKETDIKILTCDYVRGDFEK